MDYSNKRRKVDSFYAAVRLNKAIAIPFVPTELWNLILNLLDPWTLWVSARLVSRLWNRLFWRIPHLGDLSRLPLSWRADGTRTVIAQLAQKSFATSTTLALPPADHRSPYCEYRVKAAITIYDLPLISALRQLQQLDLGALEFDPDVDVNGWNDMCRDLAGTLTRLVVPHRVSFPHQPASVIYPGIQMLTRLCSLDLSTTRAFEPLGLLSDLRHLTDIKVYCFLAQTDFSVLKSLRSFEVTVHPKVTPPVDTSNWTSKLGITTLTALRVPSMYCPGRILLQLSPNLVTLHTALPIASAEVLQQLGQRFTRLTELRLMFNAEYWGEHYANVVVNHFPRLKRLTFVVTNVAEHGFAVTHLRMLTAIAPLANIRVHIANGTDPSESEIGVAKNWPDTIPTAIAMSPKLSFSLHTDVVGWACLVAEEDVVETLVSAPEIPPRLPGDWDPLLLACSSKKFRAAQALVQHGADIRVRTPSNESLIDIALKRLERDDVLLDTIAGLLSENCCPGAVSITGGNALYWAVLRDNIDVIRMLLRAGASVEPSHGKRPILYVGSMHALDVLIDAGADPHPRPEDDHSLVAQCIVRTNLDWLERVLTHLGCNPNLPLGTHHPVRRLFGLVSEYPTHFLMACLDLMMEHGLDISTAIDPDDDPLVQLAEKVSGLYSALEFFERLVEFESTQRALRNTSGLRVVSALVEPETPNMKRDVVKRIAKLVDRLIVDVKVPVHPETESVLLLRPYMDFVSPATWEVLKTAKADAPSKVTGMTVDAKDEASG